MRKLAQVTGEVREGANALASASAQVSLSSHHLSQGTSEQASSEEETTASLGVHGEGFAVVATEVRRLAERSRTAAREISGLASGSEEVAARSGWLLDGLTPSAAILLPATALPRAPRSTG